MQHSANEIKEKLLKALDREYNVVDMAAAFEVIGILERTNITKEALERTRIGKHINELRKKTSNEALAKRAKDLVRLWRTLVIPQENVSLNGERTHQGRYGPASDNGMAAGDCRITFKTSSPLIYNRTINRNEYSPALSDPSSSSATRKSSPSSYAPKLTRPPQPSPNHHGIPGTVIKGDIEQRRLVSNPSIYNSSHYQDFIESRAGSSKSPDVSSLPNEPAISSSRSISTKTKNLVNVDVVSKTNSANKRLRKDDSVLNNSKRIKIEVSPPASGLVNGFDGDESCDSSIHSFHDNSKDIVIHASTSKEVPASSITGIVMKMKKPRNSVGKKNSSNSMDKLKDKIAAAHVRTKVKTTAQLIEELKAKNTTLASNPVVASNLYSHSPNASPSLPRSSVNLLGSDNDMSRHKTELMDKFLKDSARPSTPEFFHSMAGTSQGSRSSSQELDSKPKSYLPEVDPVDEILAQLPPINYDEIVWDDEDVDVRSSELIVNDDTVNRLQCENWEGMNGNIDVTGQFKEFHETFTRESYNGDWLHILPYVNIE